MTKHVSVAVTGAAGNIAYALLFRIASGAVFGADVTVDLRLLEIEKALPALQGVVMELQDCAFPLLRHVEISSDPRVAFEGVNWAYLIGAVPRKQGMERSDLLGINGGIFVPQGQAIAAVAAEDVRVFVVGNPCNANCLIAMNAAQDVPNDRFFAMTLLDQNRAVAQLALKADVSLSAVKNMVIWGNHSATQYPDFYHADIQGKPATEIIDEAWLREDFIPLIQQRGAAVIKARGASSAASAANAAIDGVRALINDTEAGNSYSMARCSQGEYGVDEGLIFSFPCRTEQGQLQVVEGITHNEFGQQKLQATLAELRQERDMAKQLGLI